MVRMDVKVVFAERLAEALAEEEIRASIAEIRPRPGEESVGAEIEALVLGQRDELLEEVEAHRRGWEQAAAVVDQTIEDLAPRERALRATVTLGAAIVFVLLGMLIVSLFIGLSRVMKYILLGGWMASFFLEGSVLWRITTERLVARLPQKQRDLAAAEARLVTVIGIEVTAAVRRAINARLRSMSTTFNVTDKRGLRELSSPGREVSTAATKELRTLMASLDGGSIGLAGARGCGKTTLMRRFASGGTLLAQGSDLRGLVVSAPVRYDAREFVLHLFARVCEEVLHPGADSPPGPSRRELLVEARGKAVARFLSLTAGFAATAGAVVLLTGRTAPENPWETGILLLAGAGVCAIGALVAWVAAMPADRQLDAILPFYWKTSKPEAKWSLFNRLSDIVAEQSQARRASAAVQAEDRLADIRFQQTFASGWSGGLGLPFGLKLGGDEKLTLSRTPWSLPEAVDAFRRFVTATTKTHYLVIGIDELDKMESDEAARQFLNDIKGVFGVRRCFYLVSVSEDAMSSFERRGLPFRDVFDSSFDAIQNVGYLTLAESVDVLESRATGLPVPYLCLCHCLAGGLPRDLIRVARELVGRQEQEQLVSLTSLCAELVGRDLRAKANAAAVGLRTVTGADRDWLLQWIQRQVRAGGDPVALRDRCRELADWNGLRSAEDGTESDRRLRAIAHELMAFAYYSATILEFFGDDDRLMALLDRDHPPLGLAPGVVATVETLAVARQQFSVSPALAIQEVARFRAATWLTAWD
jgi:hypothetical protein